MKIMKVTIPVSVGELIDKITILEIKSIFTDSEYVLKELEELNLIKDTLNQSLSQYECKLKKVNKKLWDIEDKIRQKEKENKFDEEFVDLARSVYKTNDERARIKKEINQFTNSKYMEIKLY